MTPALFGALALAGGLGATARVALDGLVRAHTDHAIVWATALINLSGSLLLGLISGLVIAHTLPDAWQVVVGTGFLGGYTTFSTASYETVRLVQQGRRSSAVGYGVGTLIAATALAGAGLRLGALI
ncbi:fluoride efflux transporter FluC [Skermania piniformis]|uniref:Fluoride-specific ion channel FluC n=1 Tax=Skermania pinensis TaxID=39122 RepID=A0ABX8S769_9ACTN|nr:CrcB family protein [Skermania piniformis]QXQ12360.1 CrcB family protein [Skermania piniformis]